jgi:hypothetical protein
MDNNKQLIITQEDYTLPEALDRINKLQAEIDRLNRFLDRIEMHPDWAAELIKAARSKAAAQRFGLDPDNGNEI